METYLMISDTTGRQYPHLVTDKGIQVERLTVTEDDYKLEQIQSLLNDLKTIRVEDRVFRTDSIIEISIIKHPKGAH